MDEKNMPQLKWIGKQTKTQEGSIANIVDTLSTFKKVPFEYDGKVSENLEAVVRVPFGKHTSHFPITTVSKRYQLVQHSEVIGMLKDASDIAGYSNPESKCYLNLTKNGERMWFTMDFSEDFNFDPGDGNECTLQFHILNSVDRSIPLCFDLGWYRWVCRNGVFSLNRSLASKRRKHTASLKIQQYVDMLKNGVENMQEERMFYTLARGTPITVGDGVLENWLESTLTPRWGVRQAARSYHIMESGKDGKVKLSDTPEEDRKIAHRIYVTDEMTVPGQKPVENAYDVINALSWVSSHQTTLQTRRWMMDDVAKFSTGLMKKLV